MIIASSSKKGMKIWGLIVVVLLFTSVCAALAALDFESADISFKSAEDR